MTSPERFRKKTLAGLVALFRDEAVELRKFRRTSAALLYIGTFICVFAVWSAWGFGEWPLLWIALAAAAGGVMIGLSLLYDASRQQWPIMKPLIDRAALERAAKDGGAGEIAEGK